ncbi:33855_t:CDS:2, partial [Gigaspora margarita]
MTLELTDADIHNRVLHHLQTILNRYKKHLDEFPNMLLPTAFLNNKQSNHLISEEQQYNVEELTELIEMNFSSKYRLASYIELEKPFYA